MASYLTTSTLDGSPKAQSSRAASLRLMGRLARAAITPRIAAKTPMDVLSASATGSHLS
jgi:hypothetical protein